MSMAIQYAGYLERIAAEIAQPPVRSAALRQAAQRLIDLDRENQGLQNEIERLSVELNERETGWAQAHRLALELECLIMDTKDMAVVSKWWDSAHEALEQWREFCREDGKVGAGDTARKIRRFRPRTEFEEVRGIHGDEVPMTDWYLCETCGDLADSISELGFCYTIGGESLQQQIAEYRETEAAEREWQKTHNANVTGAEPAGVASGGRRS